jgi:hypothetical protein
MFSRPDSTEYAEFYKSYIARVPEGNVLAYLAEQPAHYRQLLSSLSEESATAELAPGKWSTKQMLGHVCDAERVMSYRAMRFARGDETELPGFEEGDYAREANSNARTVRDLLEEFESLRKATIALFGSMAEVTDVRRGVANGHPVTVRALAYIVAGHAQHHYEALQRAAAARSGS